MEIEYQEMMEVMAHRLAGEPCVICGAPSDGMGVFVPDNPEEYGAAAGKCRFIFYQICDKCRAPGTKALETVEAILMQEFTQTTMN